MAQNHTSKIWSYFSVKWEDDVKAQCNHNTASKIRIRIWNRPEIRRQLTESGIQQKITIHPSLDQWTNEWTAGQTIEWDSLKT